MKNINKEEYESRRTLKLKPDGEIFYLIDLQLELGLITPEKHKRYKERGIYGWITPVPDPFYEVVFPHRWWE